MTDRATKGAIMNPPQRRMPWDMDVSLRIVRIYDAPSDGFLVRLDALLNAERVESVRESNFAGAGGVHLRADQFNQGFYAEKSLMSLPQHIIDGTTFRAHHEDLVKALRALANEIEATRKQV